MIPGCIQDGAGGQKRGPGAVKRAIESVGDGRGRTHKRSNKQRMNVACFIEQGIRSELKEIP
jgi:hypothetical protein